MASELPPEEPAARRGWWSGLPTAGKVGVVAAGVVVAGGLLAGIIALTGGDDGGDEVVTVGSTTSIPWEEWLDDYLTSSTSAVAATTTTAPTTTVAATTTAAATTTVAPTTAPPTTLAPTTAPPTVAPTTAPPTTVPPTAPPTAPPTTAKPTTTPAPTTVPPTTPPPTTVPDEPIVTDMTAEQYRTAWNAAARTARLLPIDSWDPIDDDPRRLLGRAGGEHGVVLDLRADGTIGAARLVGLAATPTDQQQMVPYLALFVSVNNPALSDQQVQEVLTQLGVGGSPPFLPMPPAGVTPVADDGTLTYLVDGETLGNGTPVLVVLTPAAQPR